MLVKQVELLAGSQLDAGQRAQVFFRLADGGLGFSSAEVATEAAYLASWALTLKEVASCLGVSSWGSFQGQCGPLADKLAAAERKLLIDMGGVSRPLDWVGFLSEPRSNCKA